MPISFRIFQFVVIHTVKGFGIVNQAEIDVFLELSCFFNDPVDVGNLISGSSAFSKTSLNIWKFMVHVLLKPGLENFEHYFTNVGPYRDRSLQMHHHALSDSSASVCALNGLLFLHLRPGEVSNPSTEGSDIIQSGEPPFPHPHHPSLDSSLGRVL